MAQTTTTPVIAGVSPSSSVPGTVVTITGTNLAGTTGVTFNGVPTTGLTVTSSNSVAAYVPVGATTGAVQVVAPTSTVTSAATFTVTAIRPDVAVSATPAGPLSGCSSPTLTAAATVKPFLPSGTGLNGTAFATVVQPDGKVLVAGYFDRYNGAVRGGVVRLNADGTLDATFAPTGTGLNYDVRTMALQADGKVLVGGYFDHYNSTAVAYLARLNADGTLDATFQQSGTGFDGFVQAIAVQPNGKILVGGSFTNYNSSLRVALARLNADGTLDTGFVLPGSGIIGTVSALVVQPDSKLLIGGYLQKVNNVARGSIIRLNADGSLDATFASTNGVVNSTVLTMVRQPDGKVVAGGGFTNASGAAIAMGRLNANGTLDRTFAMTGFGFSNSINTLALQPDGRLVVGGIFTSYNGIVRNHLARINADGTLDTSFAATGAGPATGAEDVALQPDGKIIVVGSWTNFNGVAHPRLVRVASDGTLDETPTPAAGVTYAWSPGGSTGATVVAATTGGAYQATATVAGYSFSSNTVTVTACAIVPPAVPTITSFSPASGVVGTVVTVTGTGLTGATALTLSGVAVPTYLVVNATTLTFSVPAGSTSGVLAITTPGGTATSATAFTVLVPNPVPMLASLAPGTVVAGSPAFTLAVMGTGFGAGSVVAIAGVALATTYLSTTQLTAAVPAAAVAVAGSYGVAVTNPALGGGTSAALALVVTVPAPTLTSFTPASGPVGTLVMVVGTNLSGATALTLNGALISNFTVATATALSFVVPAGATSGPVAVTTPGGTATSAAVFTVIAPTPTPAITSLAPATAVAGSTALTLTVNGTGFIGGSGVSFNGVALTTTYLSATQLTAAVPAMALATAGSYDVLVTNPAPGGGTSAPATFTVTTPVPTLVSFAPASGLVGTLVMVMGANLAGATVVLLNGVPVGSFTVVDAATLTFVVPAGASSGLIAITTPGGTASSITPFTVLVPNPVPTISSLSPASALVGSGAVALTVRGTGFVTGSVVRFNGTPLATTYGSAMELAATIPAAALATAGTYPVAVENPAPGGGTSPSVVFSVLTPTPTLVSFAPASGPVGTLVTVAGTNLTGTTAVALNGTSVNSFAVLDAENLMFTVPDGATSGLISLTTPGGTATSTTAFTVTVPNVVPVLTSLSPGTVVAGSGNFMLVVNGTGFVNSSVVNFNGLVLATAYASATQLTAQVPASAVASAGSFGVTVTSPAPGGGISAPATFTVMPPAPPTPTPTPAPTLVAFTPATGLVGTLVTVMGTNLTGATAVTLNGLIVSSFTILNITTLTFSVPVGATSGLVAVTTPGGTATSATAFTVLLPTLPTPTIASLAPGSVAAGSGAFALTVLGTGFVNGSVVSFNGTALSTTYASATQLTAQVPASLVATVGAVAVVVANPTVAQGGTSSAVSFTITPPVPTLVSFTPDRGVVGTTVTVMGTAFVGATLVTLNGLSVGSFAVLDVNTLTFSVPAGASSGLIAVTTPSGTATSTTAFTVVVPNPVPTITSLVPNSAVAGQGDFTLVVMGTGFVNNAVVIFNGTALPTTYASASQLTAAVPAAAVTTAGSYPVVVVTPAPGGGSSGAVPFTVVVPSPAISSFTPASGPVGTAIAVTGTNLTGTTAVTLNGVALSSYAVVNATTLTFTVPAGATSGLITLTTPGGTATSATAFTVLVPNPVPVLASLSPSTAVAGSSAVSLTVRGSGFSSSAAVSFNGNLLATNYISATQLLAVVPASALSVAGSYDVTVSNPAPGGGSSAALPFVVTVPAPTISSFTPTAGGAGTLVMLTGTSLIGATQVYIGSVLIPTFTVVSATSLTFVIPVSNVAVSGFITVTTPWGTATSTTVFGSVLAIASSQTLPELQVYPNPFQATLTLVLPRPGVAQVALHDVAGRLVLPLTPLSATGRLQLPSDLPTGIYLLEVHQGDSTTTHRLIKQ